MQDSTRKQFEDWITSAPFEKSIERNGDDAPWPGNYRYSGVQLAWCAWESSAKAEREACAKICDELGGDIDQRDPDEGIMAANSLAHAIRTRSNDAGKGRAACGTSSD